MKAEPWKRMINLASKKNSIDSCDSNENEETNKANTEMKNDINYHSNFISNSKTAKNIPSPIAT